jgi:hypothetical protein
VLKTESKTSNAQPAVGADGNGAQGGAKGVNPLPKEDEPQDKDSDEGSTDVSDGFRYQHTKPTWRCVRTLYMTLPGGNTACVVTLNVRVENGVVIDVSSGTISVLVTVY